MSERSTPHRRAVRRHVVRVRVSNSAGEQAFLEALSIDRIPRPRSWLSLSS